jgi:hypothetical protein
MTSALVLTCLNDIGLGEVLNFASWVIGHESQDMLKLVCYSEKDVMDDVRSCLGDLPTSSCHRWSQSAPRHQEQQTCKGAS